MQVLGGTYLKTALRPLGWDILRWILAIAFLPYEAYISLDAATTSLHRMFISHRNLLQWPTAAQTASIFGLKNRRIVVWQKMGASTLLAVVLTMGLQILYDMTSSGVAPALIY